MPLASGTFSPCSLVRYAHVAHPRCACQAARVESSSIVVIAAILLVYAAFSRRLEGTSVTGAMMFVAAGFLTGAELLDWLHLGINDTNVSALAEATLVVVLFTDASRIELRALRTDFSLPARLLGIGLPLTIGGGSRGRSDRGAQHHLG